MSPVDSFGAAADLHIGSRTYRIYRLDALIRAGVGDLATLPYSLRILLENLLRYEDGKTVSRARTSRRSPPGTRRCASSTRCSCARPAC
jgi:aconitase A